jgi:hypothetical protein
MKLNLTLPHWFIVGITVALYALPKLDALVPAIAPVGDIVLQVAPIILAGLGISSSSGVTTKVAESGGGA